MFESGKVSMQAAAGFMRVVSTTRKKHEDRKDVTNTQDPVNGKLPYTLVPLEIKEKSAGRGKGQEKKKKKPKKKQAPKKQKGQGAGVGGMEEEEDVEEADEEEGGGDEKKVRLEGTCSVNLQGQWIQDNSLVVDLPQLPSAFTDFGTDVAPLLKGCCKGSSALRSVLNDMDLSEQPTSVSDFLERGGGQTERGLPAMFSFTVGGPKQEMRFSRTNFAAYSFKVKGLGEDDETYNRKIWAVVGPRFSTSMASTRILSPSIGIALLWGNSGGGAADTLDNAQVRAQITLTPVRLVAVTVDWVPQPRDQTWLTEKHFSKRVTNYDGNSYSWAYFKQAKLPFFLLPRRNVMLESKARVLQYADPQSTSQSHVIDFLKNIDVDSVCNAINMDVPAGGDDIKYFDDEFHGGPTWYVKHAVPSAIEFIQRQLEMMYVTHVMKMVVFTMTLEGFRLQGVFGPEFQTGKPPQFSDAPQQPTLSRLRFSDMVASMMTVFAPADWMEGDVSMGNISLTNQKEFWYGCRTSSYKRIWPKWMREVMYMWHTTTSLFPFGHSLQRDMTIKDQMRMQTGLVLLLDQLIKAHAVLKYDLSQKGGGGAASSDDDRDPLIDDAAVNVYKEVKKEVSRVFNRSQGVRAVIENKLFKLKFHLDKESGKAVSLDTFLRKDNTFNLHSARLIMPVLSQEFEVAFNMKRSVCKILPYYAEVQNLFLPPSAAFTRSNQPLSRRRGGEGGGPGMQTSATAAAAVDQTMSAGLTDQFHDLNAFGEVFEDLEGEGEKEEAYHGFGEVFHDLEDEGDTPGPGANYFGMQAGDEENDGGSAYSNNDDNPFYARLRAVLNNIHANKFKPSPVSRDGARGISSFIDNANFPVIQYTPTSVPASQLYSRRPGISSKEDEDCMLTLNLDLGSKTLEVHVERHRPPERSRRQTNAGGGGGGGQTGGMQCCLNKSVRQPGTLPTYQSMIEKMQLDRAKDGAMYDFNAAARKLRGQSADYKLSYWRKVYAGIDNWLSTRIRPGEPNDAIHDITNPCSAKMISDTLGQYRTPTVPDASIELVRSQFAKIRQHVSAQKDNSAWLITVNLNNGEKETRWGGAGPEPVWSEFVLRPCSRLPAMHYWAYDYNFPEFMSIVQTTDPSLPRKTYHHDFAGFCQNPSLPTAPSPGVSDEDIKSVRFSQHWHLYDGRDGHKMMENTLPRDYVEHDPFWTDVQHIAPPDTSTDPPPPTGSVNCNFGGYMSMCFPPRSTMGIYMDKFSTRWCSFYGPPSGGSAGQWFTNNSFQGWTVGLSWRGSAEEGELYGPDWRTADPSEKWGIGRFKHKGGSGTSSPDRQSTPGPSGGEGGYGRGGSSAPTPPRPPAASARPTPGFNGSSGTWRPPSTHPPGDRDLGGLPSLQSTVRQAPLAGMDDVMEGDSPQRPSSPPPQSPGGASAHQIESSDASVDVAPVMESHSYATILDIPEAQIVELQRRQGKRKKVFTIPPEFRQLSKKQGGADDPYAHVIARTRVKTPDGRSLYTRNILMPFHITLFRSLPTMTLREFEASLFKLNSGDEFLPWNPSAMTHDVYISEYIKRAVIKFYGTTTVGKSFFAPATADAAKAKFTQIALEKIMGQVALCEPGVAQFHSLRMRMFKVCKDLIASVGSSYFDLHDFSYPGNRFQPKYPNILEKLYGQYNNVANISIFLTPQLFRTDMVPTLPDAVKNEDIFRHYIGQLVVLSIYHFAEFLRQSRSRISYPTPVATILNFLRSNTSAITNSIQKSKTEAAIDQYIAEIPPPEHPPTPAVLGGPASADVPPAEREDVFSSAPPAAFVLESVVDTDPSSGAMGEEPPAPESGFGGGSGALPDAAAAGGGTGTASKGKPRRKPAAPTTPNPHRGVAAGGTRAQAWSDEPPPPPRTRSGKKGTGMDAAGGGAGGFGSAFEPDWYGSD